MQNKPNLPDAQMNVTTLVTIDYENISDWKLGENKPNTKPIKANTNPIPERPKMNENLFATKVYENITTFRLEKNKPNLSRRPVRRSFSEDGSLWRSRIKPNFPIKKTPQRLRSPQGYKKLHSIPPIYLNSQNAFYCVWYPLSDSSTILSSFFVLFLVFRGILTAVPSRPSSPATSG
jgi:hypothetical protein